MTKIISILIKIWNYIKGKKTYALGVIGVLWAIYGWASGYIPAEQAQGIIWASLTAMALRHSI